ncbi:MAG: hypothetical protein CMN77_00090 [Spirochaetaceae bacterium]|jgi:mercuric ion transport protein|nr:hypothetical protein [Spirochaetaceae bacterium]MBR29680.1 hypothetical protein [Spirochaetaceae bacterium]|tara:strand:- start:3455 stop:4165 length:711 start_codon:yes stop_codon:yes gene_type:complete
MELIELIYDADCPNAGRARQAILSALSVSKKPLRWIEWDRGDEESPPHAKAYGSPTILVNGKDVGGLQPDEATNSCRLYEAGARAPSAKAVIRLLSSSVSDGGTGGSGAGRRVAGTLPAVGLAMLPKLTCAACFPAYAAILGSLGIGLWNYTPYLLPLTIASLAIVLFMLAFRARRRRGYMPLIVGVIVSLAIIFSKFYLHSDPLLYVGIAGLILVSGWNAWPKRALSGEVHCNHC